MHEKQDNSIADCKACGVDTQYAATACTLVSNTVCKQCSRPQWLVTREVQPCTATADAVLTECILAAEKDPGNVCNPCPAGAVLLQGLCTACPAGSSSSAGGASQCTQCPAGQVSGPGASRCTVRCPVAGSFAPDGVHCIVGGAGVATRVVARMFAGVSAFDGGAQLPSGGFVGVQNFMVSGRGALWRVDSGGDGWGVGGDASQPGVADGTGPEARFGRIGGLAAAAHLTTTTLLLLTEPDLGTVRRLVYDGTAVFRVTTLLPLSGDDWAPGGVTGMSDGVFLVADATHHCVWRINAALLARRVWRGTAGTIATDFVLPPANTVLSPSSSSPSAAAALLLLAQPTHVAVIEGVGAVLPAFADSTMIALVMDARAVWAFDPSLPPSDAARLQHVCGNPDDATGLAFAAGVDDRCTLLHLGKTGVRAMTAGMIGPSSAVVVLAYQRPNGGASGILIFELHPQPASQRVRVLTTAAPAASLV